MFCRMILIFCVNTIWIHSNIAIRQFTMNNSVVCSRRQLLLRSSWQISTFLLCAVGYIWMELESMEIVIGYGITPIHIILFLLIGPTFICSLMFLTFVPSKHLRIKYLDESCIAVTK